MYIMNKIHPPRMIGLDNSIINTFTYAFAGYKMKRYFKEIPQMKDIIKYIKR